MNYLVLFVFISLLLLKQSIECKSKILDESSFNNINKTTNHRNRLILNNFLLKQFKNVSLCKYYKCNYSIKINDTIFNNASISLDSGHINGNKITINNSLYFIRYNFNLLIYLNKNDNNLYDVKILINKIKVIDKQIKKLDTLNQTNINDFLSQIVMKNCTIKDDEISSELITNLTIFLNQTNTIDFKNKSIKCDFENFKFNSQPKSHHQISKRDVQEYKIKFSKNLFNFKLLEKQPIDTFVGRITFNDIDRKYFEQFNTTLVATRDIRSNQMFSFDKQTFELKTRQVLDSKSIGTHYLRLYLHDKLNKSSTIASCSIVITVVDSNNNPPIFKLNKYEAQVFENNAPDTLVIKVEAIDPDYGENGHLTYHLISSNEDYSKLKDNLNKRIKETSIGSIPFQIKSDTGEIYAKRILNREQKDLYILSVVAIDNGQNRLSTMAQLIIRVLPQISQNSPLFDQKEYNLILPENADYTKRPVINQVKASDSNNSTLIYSLYGNLNDMNTFEIDPQNGMIRLVSKLNYELKNYYKLNVIARDLGQPPSAAHTSLIINIEDMNQNPPAFTAPFYEFILFENAKIGSVVGRVFAYDRDTSTFNNNNMNNNNNTKITYSIESSQAESFPFGIDSKNGTIFTIQKLSKNYKHGYEFYVTAIDIRRSSSINQSFLNSTVKVKVKILDINDIVPEFTKSSYKININEEAALGLPLLTLNVNNNNNPNSMLEYSFESGNDNDMFALIKQNNNRIYLTLERNTLNYKKQSFYDLYIKVMDQDGLYSLCNVQINVMPNKNFSPRFTRDLFTFQINENAPKGTLIGNISAFDFDDLNDDSSNNIIFKLITNTDQSEEHAKTDFYLDESSGKLYVSNLLDREKYDSITLYVTASDKFKPYKSDHAVIQIQILDSNDNAPQFTRSFYQVNVYDDTRMDSYLLRVEANDKDLGQNSNVRYSLLFNDNMDEFNFHVPIGIDPITGIIRLKQTHNDETPDFYNITLIASDLGQPSLSSKSYLIINNIFEIDSAPYFDNPNMVFYLLENQPIGTIVGELMARDSDLGNNADIVYKIISNINDQFELKSTGVFNKIAIVTKFIADYNSNNKQFDLTIRAHSGNLYNDCFVKILLRNSLNDNPIQIPSVFKVIFNNYKNYFITEQTARVPVQNLDPTSNLTFSILDPIGRQVVSLDSRTGHLTLKSLLNSNNQINITFGIGVTDGTYQVKTQCELIVLMLSDNLISESVTLTLYNIDLNSFLIHLYDKFVESVLKSIPSSQFKKSNIHIFNLATSTDNSINISLSISYDYEKDLFMQSSILKQILYSNLNKIQSELKLNRMVIYEDKSCSIEPCLNYQQCSTQVKFNGASSHYLFTSQVQFRSIDIKHDFSCSCPIGFTGTNVSLMCDLEINLCYSNPCGQNGVCISLESSFVCICDPDYTGLTCETSLKNMKCCESQPLTTSTVVYSTLSTSSTQKYKNLTSSIAGNNCVPSNNKQSMLPSLLSSNSNRICKADSVCKNLILGGVICENCELSKQDIESGLADRSYFTKNCELRSRHFPKDSHSFIILPGIRNRFRFRIKLTFATIKSNGLLFYNGRLDRDKTSGFDFISLNIDNDYLKFSYSLGDQQINHFLIDELSVTDGKWRTITIEYVNRNFTFLLDNDNFDDIDSCELAHSLDCKKYVHYHEMAKKCSNQIESCFRYFDLNGPFYMGKSPLSKNNDKKLSHNNYEGCIKDVYMNEKIIDLQEDLILNHGTVAGCLPKVNTCGRNVCAKCKHIWMDKINCLPSSNSTAASVSENSFGLQGYGYLNFEQIKLEDNKDFGFQFYVRINNQNNNMSLLYLNIFNKQKIISEPKLIYLQYDSVNKKINLIDESALSSIAKILISLNKNIDLGNDFWHKIELNIIYSESLIEIIIDDVFRQTTNSKLLQNVLQSDDSYVNFYIGGHPSITTTTGLIGCVKNIQKNDLSQLLPIDIANATKGCSFNRAQPKCNRKLSNNNTCEEQNAIEACGSNNNSSPCYNNGTCVLINEINSNEKFRCDCRSGFNGKYCQYEKKTNMKLLANKNSCPAKWWGKEPGICGPCQCDESKNFSPDCNKTTGQCFCKSKFYKQINKITKEERCVPCDCYLEGSTSLQCDTLTGQCSCIKGAGITGRRCDQCVSPFAEMVTKGNECRQLSSNECPKAFAFNIWWPRTTFGSRANASCPKGSEGRAYRSCGENQVGWLNDIDLSDCRSNQIIDSQLFKLTQELQQKKSELNSYQAFKLVEDLTRITSDADLEDNLVDSDLYNSYVSTFQNSLYANDLLVIKNITKYIIDYEIENAPSFLYIQDKYFLTNIFSTFNRILNKKYDLKMYKKLSINDYLTDLIISLDKYLKVIVQYNQEYSLSDDIELIFQNVQFYFRKNQAQSLSETLPNIKFKLINSEPGMQKLSYISINSASNNLPNKLLYTASSSTSSKNKRQLLYSSQVYQIVSNVFAFYSHQSDVMTTSTSTISNKTTFSSSPFYIVIDFVLTNNYDANYDTKNNIINYRQIKASKLDYKCVYLDQDTHAWSTYGSKLISYDPIKNTVKCSFDHFSIYAVITPSGSMIRSNSAPINFSIPFYVIMSISLFILTITLLCLLILRRFKTPLTVIYTNLCLNILLMQFIFLMGVNSNQSQIACKFVSILQHYLNLSSYLWMFLIGLHLYRMLTELRDINKIGSCSPVFYYVIAYVIPTIVVSLTLGIKQDIYTNFDTIGFSNNYPITSLDLSSVYCWLNLNSYNEIFFVFLLPIGIITFSFLLMAVLSYRESKKSTFKQTDVSLVYYSLIGSLILLPFQCLMTVFLMMFLSAALITNNSYESTLYQHLYLSISFIYSILLFLIFIVFNKNNKMQLMKAWSLIKNRKMLNDSLDGSKSKMNYKPPFAVSKEPLAFTIEKKNIIDDNNMGYAPNLMHHQVNHHIHRLNNPINIIDVNQQLNKMNKKYILDYHDYHNQTNSISTTTTSGTMENDETNSQDSEYIKQGLVLGVASSNGYLSNLANTTNTESTVNESDFNYNFDFNRQMGGDKNNIRECDVIDVGQVLKSRSYMMNANMADSQNENNSSEMDDNNQHSYIKIAPATLINKNFNNNNNRESSKYYNVNCVDVNFITQNNLPPPPAINNQTTEQMKKNAALQLFWPNTIAECDTSFLEGSVVYTPTKLPFQKHNDLPANEIIQNNSTSSSNSTNTTNTGSNTNSNNNIVNVNNFNSAIYSNNIVNNLHHQNNYNPNNLYSTVNNHAVLTSNGNINNKIQSNQMDNNSNKLSRPITPNVCSIVPIFNHTGSPTTSDNE